MQEMNECVCGPINRNVVFFFFKSLLLLLCLFDWRCYIKSCCCCFWIADWFKKKGTQIHDRNLKKETLRLSD